MWFSSVYSMDGTAWMTNKDQCFLKKKKRALDSIIFGLAALCHCHGQLHVD